MFGERGLTAFWSLIMNSRATIILSQAGYRSVARATESLVK
jgi:hypothetical protein